jgi:hypothetical protein
MLASRRKNRNEHIKPGYFIRMLKMGFKFMIVVGNKVILRDRTMFLPMLCGFWKNFSGPKIDYLWSRLDCNHSYGYAFRRIAKTGSLKFSQNSAFL